MKSSILDKISSPKDIKKLSFEELAPLCTEIRQLLIENGWTWSTAVSVMLFSLMHWPCSTTCLTIQKETQSIKWTAISFLVPTVAGITVCFLFHQAVQLLG